MNELLDMPVFNNKKHPNYWRQYNTDESEIVALLEKPDTKESIVGESMLMNFKSR